MQQSESLFRPYAESLAINKSCGMQSKALDKSVRTAPTIKLKLGSRSYSKDWPWNLGTKGMLHCFRKVRCQLGDTPGSSLLKFNVSYKFL